MAPTGDSGKTDNKPSTTGGTTKGNTAVPHEGDHDRVQMLSLKSDGTPDQTPRVEIIGDPEFAKQAAREQFAQQAVSAHDRLHATSEPMMVVGGKDGETELKPASEAPQDPSIQERKDEHDKAQEAAHKAADAAVDALFEGDAKAAEAKSTSSVKPADKA